MLVGAEIILKTIMLIITTVMAKIEGALISFEYFIIVQARGVAYTNIERIKNNAKKNTTHRIVFFILQNISVMIISR